MNVAIVFADFAPVIIITLVGFLLISGVLSALLTGINNLGEWLRGK